MLCPNGPRSASVGGAKVTLADPTQLALGLLYIAALHNNAEAQLILSYRFALSSSVIICI